MVTVDVAAIVAELSWRHLWWVVIASMVWTLVDVATHVALRALGL